MVEGIFSFLSTDAPVLIDNVRIDIRDHIHLRMSCITLYRLDITSIEL